MNQIFRFKYLSFFLVMIMAVIMVSCGEDEKEKVTREKVDTLTPQVTKIATKFWKEMSVKNYENAFKYATPSSEKSLVKLSRYQENIAYVQFQEVDSCWYNVDTTRAFCEVLYVQSFQDKSEVIQLVKSVYGWKVEYILDETNDPTLIYDYSLNEAINFSEELDPLFSMSTVDLDYFKYFVHTIGGDLALGMVDESTLKDTVEVRLNKYNVPVEFLEDRNPIEIDYYFPHPRSIEITISNYDEGYTDEVFQSFITVINEQYGMPFNAKKVNSKDYYKYISLRWFSSSYNQEIEIRNFKTSIVVTISAIV